MPNPVPHKEEMLLLRVLINGTNQCNTIDTNDVLVLKSIRKKLWELKKLKKGKTKKKK